MCRRPLNVFSCFLAVMTLIYVERNTRSIYLQIPDNQNAVLPRTVFDIYLQVVYVFLYLCLSASSVILYQCKTEDRGSWSALTGSPARWEIRFPFTKWTSVHGT